MKIIFLMEEAGILFSGILFAEKTVSKFLCFIKFGVKERTWKWLVQMTESWTFFPDIFYLLTALLVPSEL